MDAQHLHTGEGETHLLLVGGAHMEVKFPSSQVYWRISLHWGWGELRLGPLGKSLQVLPSNLASEVVRGSHCQVKHPGFPGPWSGRPCTCRSRCAEQNWSSVQPGALIFLRTLPATHSTATQLGVRGSRNPVNMWEAGHCLHQQKGVDLYMNSQFLHCSTDTSIPKRCITHSV